MVEMEGKEGILTVLWLSQIRRPLLLPNALGLKWLTYNKSYKTFCSYLLAVWTVTVWWPFEKYCRFALASFVYPQATFVSLAGGSVGGLPVKGLIQFDKKLICDANVLIEHGRHWSSCLVWQRDIPLSLPCILWHSHSRFICRMMNLDTKLRKMKNGRNLTLWAIEVEH